MTLPIIVLKSRTSDYEKNVVPPLELLKYMFNCKPDLNNT